MKKLSFKSWCIVFMLCCLTVVFMFCDYIDKLVDKLKKFIKR